MHVANTHVAKLHAIPWTFPKKKTEEAMSICNRKDLGEETTVRPKLHRQVYHGQMKSPARSTAQARDSAAIAVSSGSRADVSMDLPSTCFYR